jgi:hypothetical protein
MAWPFQLSCPGLTHGCPVNLSFTMGLYGVPARWSMRSWESLRLFANRRQGLPRSHGPADGRVDRQRVNLRLTSRRAGFLPGVATALAFGRIRAMLDRTAVGLTRASTARSSEVAARSGPWIAGSSPAMTASACCARHAHRTMRDARQSDSRGLDPGIQRRRVATSSGRVGACRSALTPCRHPEPGKGPTPSLTRGPGRAQGCPAAAAGNHRAAG